jgi:hypothetical protein
MSMERMLRWFPSAWRARYEAEVRELLEAHPFTWRERRDLFRGCVDAWGRELWSWAYAISRVAGAAGVRLAVLLAVGWMALQLANVLSGLAFTRGIVAGGGLWISGAAGLWVPMALMVQVFLVRPYADSGADIYRPSWVQTVAMITLCVAFAALDERSGPGRQLADMLFLGVTATMRYARWFVVFDTTRPVPTHGRRVLGLQ